MRNRSPLPTVAVVLAALGVLPIVAVLGLGLAPGHGAVWEHLAETVLSRFVVNTVALVVLVGVGVAFGGTVTAWLVTNRRFPGARF